jgi:hygromycin-B 4-O-kinase
MTFKKMNLTTENVQTFLDTQAHSSVSSVAPLQGGEWSQAFGFKQAERHLVIRFGQHEEDYFIDKFVSRYKTTDLPIPEVLEVGPAFGGYFAISERAFGTMVDDLNKADMKRIVSALFVIMNAIRKTDISATQGFGQLNPQGKSKFDTWEEVLIDVNGDEPGRKIHGWKEGLEHSLVGLEPFEETYAALTKLAKNLPSVRTLVHNDLLNFNMLVNDNKVTAVFDWANALYGDFLYDLAMFVFWEPIYEPIKGIDWKLAALAHYNDIGLDIPEFERRLLCCMINMGLGAQAYYGYKRDSTYLEPVAARTLELARQSV